MIEEPKSRLQQLTNRVDNAVDRLLAVEIKILVDHVNDFTDRLHAAMESSGHSVDRDDELIERVIEIIESTNQESLCSCEEVPCS